MRVITGIYGGRHYRPSADKWPTRPTTDISKEGLYNVLTHRIDFEETRFLDLFGGTGSHCYECLSRGCTDAHYVDKHRPAVRFVQSISEEWGLEDHLTIHGMDVFRFIKQCDDSFNYIFAGPPYPLRSIPQIPDIVLDRGLLADGGLFVLEHNADHIFKDHFRFSELRTYGGTHFSFFE